MEEPLPVSDSPPDAKPRPATSLAARLLNVFAVPGEVFAEVKAGRICVGNWLVPALLSAAIAVLTAVVIVSQPASQRQMHDLREQLAKGLEQKFKAWKINQAEADSFLAAIRTNPEPGTIKLAASASAAVISVARVFWWAFLLWLLGRLFLKVRFGYLKALEVAGLGLMISVLGAVVMLLLMVNLPGLFAAPNLASAVSDLEASLKSPLRMGAANVFSFWGVGVLSVGLAKLAGVPFLRAAWFVFGVWLIEESCVVLVLGGLGQLAP